MTDDCVYLNYATAYSIKNRHQIVEIGNGGYT